MKITAIDSFSVQVPCPEEEIRAGKYADLGLTRVQTDEGIIGWGFEEVPSHLLDSLVRPLLVGADPFHIEAFLQRGLARAAGVEWALWDIVGKAANQPIHRLLGQCRDRIPIYLTIVWPNQRAMTPAQQVDDIVRYAAAGFRAVKVQMWREDPFEDIEIIAGVRDRLGGPDKMEVMFDRMADRSGTLWSFETALGVARTEQWEPILQVLNTPELYHLDGDVMTIPTNPGLGIKLNEDAVQKFRVPPGTPSRPGPYTFPKA